MRSSRAFADWFWIFVENEAGNKKRKRITIHPVSIYHMLKFLVPNPPKNLKSPPYFTKLRQKRERERVVREIPPILKFDGEFFFTAAKKK